jgi:hypothetical protein
MFPLTRNFQIYFREPQDIQGKDISLSQTKERSENEHSRCLLQLPLGTDQVQEGLHPGGVAGPGNAGHKVAVNNGTI